jgi:drug/metabolite transporter (DMT)-like permease
MTSPACLPWLFSVPSWGLQRTSGAGASLMLTLEALFTAVLAWRLYCETMDRRVWSVVLLLLAGGSTLVLP